MISDGPFKVFEKINNNAYKVELPGDYDISATFNVVDLSPFYDDDDEELASLRSNSSKEGEDDGGPSNIDPKLKNLIASMLRDVLNSSPQSIKSLSNESIISLDN